MMKRKVLMKKVMINCHVNISKLKRFRLIGKWERSGLFDDICEIDIPEIKQLLNNNEKMFREYLYLKERCHPVSPRAVIRHIHNLNKRCPQKFA